MNPLPLVLCISLLGGSTLELPDAVVSATTDSVIRRYDLSALEKRSRGYQSHNSLLVGASVVGQDYLEFYGKLQASNQLQFDPEQTYSVILEILGEEFEYEGRLVNGNVDTGLIIKGPEALHRRVQAIIDFFSRSTTSDSSFQVDLISLAAGSEASPLPVGIVSLEQAEKLLGAARRGGTGESYSVPLNPMAVSHHDSSTAHTLLVDYDLEISERAFIYDPVLAIALTGMRFQVTASPAANGCNVSLALLHGSKIEDVRELSVNLQGKISSDTGPSYQKGPRTVQSLKIAQRSFALNTAIPTGKALIVRSNTSEEDSDKSQYIVLRQTGGALVPSFSADASATGAPIQLVRVDSFANRRLQFHGLLTESPQQLIRLGRQHLFDSNPFMFKFTDADYDSEIDTLDSMTPHLECSIEGSWLIALPSNWKDKESSQGDTTKVSIQSALAEFLPKSEVVTVTMRAIQLGRKSQHEVSCTLPLRVGDPSAAVVGVESRSVTGYDVEVAQGSAASDPISGVHLNGMAVQIHPKRVANGGLTLQLTGLVSLVRESSIFDSHSPTHAPIQLDTFDRLVLDRTVRFDGTAGQTVIVGNSAGNAQSSGIRLELTLH